MKGMKLAALVSTALAGILGVNDQALAQSTASQQLEDSQDVVITAAKPRGLIKPETAAKSRSTIGQAYIETQPAGQTILQSVNLAPGVNFTNQDAYGSQGGDITMRGFDSARISLTMDGTQLNDTGNYAIFSNQQLDPELIDRANVNLGTTDVDSPTASATGGTVNYVTRKPKPTSGLTLSASGGTDEYRRLFGLADTGAFGPFGTMAWFSASYTNYDKFKGLGEIEKKQVNFRVYQPIGNDDFVSVSLNYNENRNNFIRRLSLTNFNNGQYTFDYDATCVRPAPVNGTSQNEATTATGFTATCANYYNNNINPSNTGNIRGQSSFGLTENLRLTIDPTFQYVLANGGGRTIMPENDARLIGTSGALGKDLNGDGDVLDRVLLYWPNTTNTRRYSVTSSLLWDFADNQHLRVAYTYDYGRHRQTGDAGFFNQLGDPENVFGGKDGQGTKITTADGNMLRRRDRFSIATLSQIALEYRADFLDERLGVNVGLRAPTFSRDLNNFCFQQDTFNAYCTTQTPSAPDSAGLVTIPATGATLYQPPVKFSKEYEDVLPSAGARYKLSDNQQIYASYAEGFSAPRTDDLYDRGIPSPDPETTQSYDLGYRFQGDSLTFTAAAWMSKFHNRIVRTLDEDLGIAVSRNVGDVDLKGIDGEVEWRVTDKFKLYGSASVIRSKVLGDLPNGASPPIPTKGKELVEIPKFQSGLRASYDAGPVSLGVQGKYVAARWANDVNTERAPDYVAIDADARLALDTFGVKDGYIQLNIINVGDTHYLGDISTVTTGAATYSISPPRTFMATIGKKF